jgi:hypothetical protein
VSQTDAVPDRRGLLVPDRADAGRLRWFASFVLGAMLCLAAFFATNVVPELALGRPLVGLDFALVGVLQALLIPLAALVALRPVGAGMRELGLRGPHVRADALIGLAVALAFAALQFGVLIPATGGAERSDIVVNAAQIGESVLGVIGFVVLAWTGGFAEELFFRGHFLTTLCNGLGTSRAALIVAAGVTVIVFALLHGYQGWAGVIDAGFFGGLVLTGLFLWRRGRLTACVVAHAAWNSLATIGIWLWY